MEKDFFMNKNKFFAAQTNWTPVPIEILKARKLSAPAKLVYIDICSYIYRQEDSYSFPKQQTIADDLSMSRPMVNQHLQELRNYGLITWIQCGLKKPNVYAILDFPLTGKGLPGPIQANLDQIEEIHTELKTIVANLHHVSEVEIPTSEVDISTSEVEIPTSDDTLPKHITTELQADFSGGEEEEINNMKRRINSSAFFAKKQDIQKELNFASLEGRRLDESNAQKNEQPQPDNKKKVRYKRNREDLTRVSEAALAAFELVADSGKIKEEFNAGKLEDWCVLSPGAVRSAFEETVQRGKSHFKYFRKIFFTHYNKELGKGGGKRAGGTTIDYDKVEGELYQ